MSITSTWARLVAWVRGLFVPKLTPVSIPPPTQNTAAPTAPVAGAASNASNIITVALTTASTGPNGVDHYNAYRGASSGSEVFVESFYSWPYVSSPLAAGTYYLKFTGVSPSVLESSLSNEVNTTIAGALGADTHAPSTPAQPTAESGGGSTTASVASVAPTADDSSHSGTEVVTGAKANRWYKDSVYQTGYDSLVPSIGSATVSNVGTHIATNGTDDGSTITGPVINDGTDGFYGSEDGGYVVKWEVATGKFTRVTRINSSTGGGLYGKGVVDGFGASLSPTDVRVNLICFNSAGYNKVRVEGRLTSAAGAQALSGDVVLTYPFLSRKSYDPDTGVVLMEYSQSVASPSYTTLWTGAVSNLGKTYLVTRGASGGPTAPTGTYVVNSSTSDSVVRFPFSGMPGTSVSVQSSMIDNATPPNESALGTARVFTYTAQGNGGSGASGQAWLTSYCIGGEPNMTSSRFIICCAHEHRSIISSNNSWESIYQTTLRAIYAAILAKNSDWAGVQYLNTTRTQSNNFRSAVESFLNTRPVGSGWLLLNTDGSIAKWGDQYGTDSVENIAATALDNQGRTMAQYDAAYRHDAYRKGRAGGLSSIDISANNLGRGSIWDDVFGNKWQGGDWTVGNVGSDAAIRAGYKSAWDTMRALFQASMTADSQAGTPIAAANLSQAYGNMGSDAITDYANSVDLGLAEVVHGDAYGNFATHIAKLESNIQSIIRTGGFGIYDHNMSRTVDSTELQHRRYSNAVASVCTNMLYAPRYRSEDYYLDYDQQQVRMQYYDVNTTTAAGNSSPYTTDYKGLAWRGDPVVGATGAKQTTAYNNGSFARERANCWSVLRPADAGNGYITLPVQVKKPTCSDDPAYDGTVYPAGTHISLNGGDGYDLVKWP